MMFCGSWFDGFFVFFFSFFFVDIKRHLVPPPPLLVKKRKTCRPSLTIVCSARPSTAPAKTHERTSRPLSLRFSTATRGGRGVFHAQHGPSLETEERWDEFKKKKTKRMTEGCRDGGRFSGAVYRCIQVTMRRILPDAPPPPVSMEMPTSRPLLLWR